MPSKKRTLFDKLLKRFKHNKRQYNQGHPSPKTGLTPRVYSLEEKLQILKELEQSGAPISAFAKWKGVAGNTIHTWQEVYKTKGEAGLVNKPRKIEETLPPEIIQKIVTLKKENPGIGFKKIAEHLFRHDFVKVSSTAIFKFLKRNPETRDLVAEKPEAKNPPEYTPKSFERSKPRQMYQMDITSWKLKSLYMVYIIGCIDDYSRFIVSWGVFRRQTSEHCVDVLRNAIEQYNSTPEEVLTDNGRQFYTWRGRNDYQRFLLKMGIRHIRSRPYHPQTLGKIESFWRNMYQELLSRETITSFEDLQEKLKKWIDQYNFKRPHQGIGGLVPADRFFGVEKQVREAMLEGAGMVKDALVVDPYRLARPMYLIGRIGDKEIRILAKDGSVSIQGVESVERKELPESKGESNDGEQILPPDTNRGEDTSDTIGLEQGENRGPDMPGADNQQGDVLPVGEEDIIRDEGNPVSTEEGQEEEGLGGSEEPGEGDTKAEAPVEESPEEGESSEEGKRVE